MKQLKPYTIHELTYICRFYEVDGPKNLAAALDRSDRSISQQVRRLRKKGLYEIYRKRWDRLYD